MTHILHIDSSANLTSSVTRKLSAALVARFDGARVTNRDVARNPLPQVTHTWVDARAAKPADRTSEQVAALQESDALIAEMKAADVIVIGAPVYNFNVPASLKAWIDLVARAGETFQYTADGPVGLVEGKKVYVAMASAGTPPGADHDFNTRYLRFMLGFMGMSDVTVIAADSQASKGADATAAALADIAALDI